MYTLYTQPRFIKQLFISLYSQYITGSQLKINMLTTLMRLLAHLNGYYNLSQDFVGQHGESNN